MADYGRMFGNMRNAAGGTGGFGMGNHYGWQTPKPGIADKMAPNVGVPGTSVMGQPMQPWQRSMTGQLPPFSAPQPMPPAPGGYPNMGTGGGGMGGGFEMPKPGIPGTNMPGIPGPIGGFEMPHPGIPGGGMQTMPGGYEMPRPGIPGAGGVTGGIGTGGVYQTGPGASQTMPGKPFSVGRPTFGGKIY